MELLRKKKLLRLCLFCVLCPLIFENPRIVHAKGEEDFWIGKLMIKSGGRLLAAAPGDDADNPGLGQDGRAEKVELQGLYSYASCLLDADNDRVLFAAADGEHHEDYDADCYIGARIDG